MKENSEMSSGSQHRREEATWGCTAALVPPGTRGLVLLFLSVLKLNESSFDM